MATRIGCGRLGMVLARVTMATALVLLLGGCEAAMVTIEVPLQGDKGPLCFDYTSDMGPGWFSQAAFQEALDVGQDHVNLTVPTGALLWASIDGNSTGKLQFAFLLTDGNGTRIILTRHPSRSVGYVNGRAISVDVSDADTARWLLAAPSADLAPFRSISLSGDPRVDAPALERLAGRPLAVVLPTVALAPDAREAILTALERAKPQALLQFQDNSPSATNWTAAELARIASISSLTYLGISGSEIPDLSRLPRLRCLRFCFPNPSPLDGNVRAKSLAPLARLTSLEYLELDGCKGIEDVSALANLRNLKSLTLGDCGDLTTLGPIARLTNLDTLCLGDNRLKDLSGLDRLAGLRRLALFPLPPEATDLSPIHRLKKLQVLLVEKEAMTKRQKDIAGIRQALPGVKVVGICMGSAWAVLALAIGAGAGLAVRRLRRPAGSAA